jgi:hypothetical protein
MSFNRSLGLSGDALSKIYWKEKKARLKEGQEAYVAWTKSVAQELELEEGRLNRQMVSGAPRVKVMQKLGNSLGETVSHVYIISYQLVLIILVKFISQGKDMS